MRGVQSAHRGRLDVATPPPRPPFLAAPRLTSLNSRERLATGAAKQATTPTSHPPKLAKLLQRLSSGSASESQNATVRCRPTPHSTGPKDAAEPSFSRRNILYGGLAASALLPCGCPRPAFADGAGEWGYGDLDGPRAWPGICKKGARQSPIDLPDPAVNKVNGGGLDLKLQYSDQARLTVRNTGHGNIQVDVPDGNFAEVDGRKMQLVQWHFHAPSEHAFAQERQIMEAHFVHKDVSTGGLAVLAVMLRRGGKFPALQVALDHAPTDGSVRPKKLDFGVDLNKLLGAAFPQRNGGHHCVHYTGSLTTPPCTEGVDWFVWTTLGQVADRQILNFEAAISEDRTIGTNSRPVQTRSKAAQETVSLKPLTFV